MMGEKQPSNVTQNGAGGVGEEDRHGGQGKRRNNGVRLEVKGIDPGMLPAGLLPHVPTPALCGSLHPLLPAGDTVAATGHGQGQAGTGVGKGHTYRIGLET